jgi:hypothetical protein
MSRSATTVLVCGLVSAVILTGQQPAPLFRAGSKLVEVEVTVLDKKGNPVTGLTQADFTVRDEGKLQSIAFFHFDGVTEPPAAAKTPSSAPPERQGGPLVFSKESPSWPALLVNCEFHLCAQMNPVLEPNDSHFEFHPHQ